MNQKAAPRHGANYDPEISALKQIKNILGKLQPATKQRVMAYLTSVANDPGGPPPPPVDTRQGSLEDVGL